MTTLRRALVIAVSLALLPSVAPAGEESGGYAGDAQAGRTLAQQATAAYQEGRHVEAADLFRRAYEAYQDPRFVYNVGQCYRAAGRWQDAADAYRQRVEMQPAPPNFIYVHLGRCLLELGQRQDAEAAFRRYLELEPNGDDAAQVRQALQTGRWPEDADRRPAGQVEGARQVHERAQQLIEQGQFQQAAEAYLEGYRQNAQVHELLLNAGLCYMWAGQSEQAVQTLNQYLETPGADPGAYAHIAECLVAQGNLAGARDAYQRYLQQAPNGEFAQQARRFVRFVSHMNPVPTAANMAECKQHIIRANEHGNAGRYRQALREFEAAYAIVPAVTLRYNMGVCRRGMSQWSDALQDFEFYLEQAGDEDDDAVVHLGAADCLIHLNRREDAMQHINAFRARADAGELPEEESNRQWAMELEQECKRD